MVAQSTYQGWIDELHASPNKSKAARLFIEVGEYEVGHHDPLKAEERFERAASLLPVSSPDRGLARYDQGLAQFLHGQFDDSATTLNRLLFSKLVGYDRRTCLLYERHTASCASYHLDNAKAGIPEPPFLDPLCGPAAIAVGLKRLGFAYDRQTVLRAVPHDPEGTSASDLVKSLPKLGLYGQVVTLNSEKGLLSMPLPAIAHVEHDHFIAIVRANREGVTYICSDCGPWPGGEVTLTWKQWKKMDADAFIPMVPADGIQALALANLPSKPGEHKRIRIASLGSAGVRTTIRAQHLLDRYSSGLCQFPNFLIGALYCGGRATTAKCFSFQNCAKYCPHPCSAGPASSDPLNVSTGEEQNTPSADLVVYNPIGPSVVWSRTYGSLTNMVPTGFGSGWSHSYNWRFERWYTGQGATGYQSLLHMPDGSTVPFTDPTWSQNQEVAAITMPAGAPFAVNMYKVTGTSYYYTITFKDQSVWKFNFEVSETQTDNAPWQGYSYQLYYPSQISDNFGNPINLLWENTTAGGQVYQLATPDPATGQLGSLQLTYITDKNNHPLFYIDYTSSGRIDYVSEWPNGEGDMSKRSVGYTVQSFNNTNSDPGYPSECDELTNVGQPVFMPGVFTVQGVPAPGETLIPMWAYSYANYNNNLQNGEGQPETVPYLTTIQSPSPANVLVPSSSSPTQIPTWNETTNGAYNFSTVTIAYSSNGAVSTITDGNGNVTTLTPQGTGEYATYSTITVANSAGTIARKVDAYWGSTLLPSNYVVHYLNSSGVEQTVTPYTYTYGTNSQNLDPLLPYQVTDANGRTWTFTYDAYGNCTSTTTPKSTTTTYTIDTTDYPAPGLVSKVQTTGKTAVNYTYSPTTYALASVSGPIPGQSDTGSQQTTTLTYTALGNVASITSPGNYNSTYGTGATSHSVSYNYTTDGSYSQPEALGEPLTATSTLGFVTHARYDVHGNKTLSEDPMGNTSTYTYGVVNEVTSESLPATGSSGSGHVTIDYFHLDSNPVDNYDAGGPLLGEWAYDESGNLIREHINLYGNEGESFEHYSLVPGTTTALPDSETKYDAAYRVTDYLDGNAIQNNTAGTTFSYDWAGRLQSVAYPLNSGTYDTITYSNYDGVGNVGERTDGRGIVTEYTYHDGDGLLSSVNYVNSSNQDFALSYDAYDRATSVTDQSGSRGQTYDDLDDLLTNTQSYTSPGAIEMQYGYYPDGSRETFQYPGSQISYEYDGDGRCTEMNTPAGTFTDAYDADSRTTRHTLPSGVFTAYEYLTILLKGEGIYTSGSSALVTYPFFGYDGAFDELDLVSDFSTSGASSFGGTEERSFDSFSRQTHESTTQFGNLSQTFQYDASSNPTTFVGTTQPFNLDNQLTTSSTFDGNGCPSTYEGTQCVYDRENRLTYCGSSWQAGYRSDGLRAWADAAGTTTYYYYDGDKPVLEANSSGTVTAVNYYGASGLCARTAGSTSTFYQFDPHGNVAIRTNSSGTVTNSSAFEPWGKEHAVTTPTDPFGYHAQDGYYFDRQTGLYYCDARYYDPSHGVWLTRDPAGFGGGSNLYGYCGGNPIGGSDPSGESFLYGISMALFGADVPQNLYDALQPVRDYTSDHPAIGLGVAAAGLCACQPEFLGSVAGAGGAESVGTVGTVIGIGAAAGEDDPNLPEQVSDSLGCPAMESVASEGFPDGSFSISDWSGYPEGLPRPVGPFRLLEGSEYQAARSAANMANRAMHAADPTLESLQIHEIQPVKFGGCPTDPLNKIPLTPAEHAQVTAWWNQLQRNLTK